MATKSNSFGGHKVAAVCCSDSTSSSSPQRRRCPSPKLLLSLLILSTCLASAVAKNLPKGINADFGMSLVKAAYHNHSWETPVEATRRPRGMTKSSLPTVPFVRVLTHDDQQLLYEENLYRDLAPWWRRNRSDITVSALLRWMDKREVRPSQRLLMIKKGKLAVLRQKGGTSRHCQKPCDRMLESIIEQLNLWIAESPSEWPDVVFYMNVADGSLCQGVDPGGSAESLEFDTDDDIVVDGINGSDDSGEEDDGQESIKEEDMRGRRRIKAIVERRARRIMAPCPAPILSLIKEWGKDKDEDILVPLTLGIHGWPPLHYFPWRQKIERAFFRGVGYCHTKHYSYARAWCTRTYFSYMSQNSREWAKYLDVGLVDNFTFRYPEETIGHRVYGRGFVPMPELARFRYVLALDGITASSRLARLLSLNSVVLKQTSPWIEWYYRSLIPGAHYISFWDHHPTDVMNTIMFLQDKKKYLYDVAMNGQAFAYRYLQPNARRLYWIKALTEYKKVFSDMDEFIAKQAIPDE